MSNQLDLEFYEEDKDYNSRISKVAPVRVVSCAEKKENALESVSRYMSGQNRLLESPFLWRLYRCLCGVCPYLRELQ